MKPLIAFFRGINVGGKNILSMNELTNTLESLGHKIVGTYIQSGNVVFYSKKNPPKTVSEEISAKILENKGFKPQVMVMETSDLEEVIHNNPFPTEKGNMLHCYFLEAEPPNPNMNDLIKLKSESESFELNKKVFYLYAPDGIGRSKLAAKVEKTLNVSATARNWNTILKVIEMAKKR